MYKYELDDGTEIHDPSVPSTTSCPYLPGQPVNLLWVPVEIQTPRDRSGSMSSMASGDVKTMVPADKYLTPRAPPPYPPQAIPLPHCANGHCAGSACSPDVAQAREVAMVAEGLVWLPVVVLGAVPEEREAWSVVAAGQVLRG